MQAGSLRHQVIIQRITGARDEFGAETDTWATLRTVWASIASMGGGSGRGREVFTSVEQLQAMDILNVNMRWFAGLTAKDRLYFDGRTFDILTITNPDERNRELFLTVKEHKA